MIKKGDAVEYSFYGKRHVGIISDVGTTESVVFIDNHRWMHSSSVKLFTGQRYSVLVLPYSLETGEIGKPVTHITSMDGEISRHKTLKAAARSLSKAVSCRTSRVACWLFIADMITGDEYSLRAAQGKPGWHASRTKSDKEHIQVIGRTR